MPTIYVGRLLDPAMQHGGSVSLYDGHQEDVDFIEFITKKMKAAKQYWTDKTEALRDYLTDLSQGRDDQVRQDPRRGGEERGWVQAEEAASQIHGGVR